MESGDKHERGSVPEGHITIKKTDLWKYSTFVLIAVILIGAFVVMRGGTATGGTVTDVTGDNAQAPVDAKSLIEANDPVLGDPSADISIIEFSDFECPFCERAYSDAMAQFKQSSYFTDGQANLVYKQFPLTSIHPYAQKAAEASLCADEQGKFWGYHNMLFDNQATLTSELQNSGLDAVVTSLKQYAVTLGLDSSKFNTCLDTEKYASEISKETNEATAAGGQGTPFFVLVNKKTDKATVISGAYPWSQFDSALQSIK